MAKHVTWILSNLDRSKQLRDVIVGLKIAKCDLSFVLINMTDSHMRTFLFDHGFSITLVTYHSISDLIPSIKRCSQHYKQHQTRTVHCHLLHANLIGLSSARWAGVKKRIYTRHHSTYHHQYHRKGVWLDRMVNALSTDIVAISQVVRETLMVQEGVPTTKIHDIPHGFDFNYLKRSDPFSTTNQAPVIGAVSRFMEWKGVQYIIEAFGRLLSYYPNAKLVLFGGSGSYAKAIEQQLEALGSPNMEIRSCSDIRDAYHQMDIYVHVPIDESIEAYGQTYVEASAMELPCIFTLSGIAHEFVRNERNALVVKYQNSEAIHEAMLRLLRDPIRGKALGNRARQDVMDRFTLDRQVGQLINLYTA